MKLSIFITTLILVLVSCRKEKIYKNFSQKDLDFVNYTQWQNLKYIDTNSITETLLQGSFRRDLTEEEGLYGKTGIIFEKYEVSYYTQSTNTGRLFISISTQQRTSMTIGFYDYDVFAITDSVSPAFNSMTINGINYSNVYTLRAHRRYSSNLRDTATLYHNRQYGVIQLLFPNGKRIVRTS